MKVIVVLFDTLNRKYLPNYGCDWTHLPNFERLARETATFDNCYGGSMPCMPARRELHTGRYNFLHRSWGPLEPFDDSTPEILRDHGVYTHLVTDHQHYWEDGGATYHNRFRSFEFFRGQEGDRWKGVVADPQIPESVSWRDNDAWRHDWVNRQYLTQVEDHPQTLTVNAGLEFIQTNSSADNWMLQIECFDPHEPFLSYSEHKQHYLHDYEGPHFDWPDYRRVTENDSAIHHARREYAALMTMCDASLGRILDSMDQHGLWDDTMLIVMTDHGLLLGEHGWWGKNIQPWYEENIHTPLFIWDPRSRVRDERRATLVQTIDIAPTLLGFFDARAPVDMQGHDLADTIKADVSVREAGLFGSYGGHVNVTDGRFVYMRTCAEPDNRPLLEFTLMPTHMNARFAPEELRTARLAPPFSFTKGTPVLELPGQAVGSPYSYGCLLFDVQADPEQLHPMIDDEIELRMINLLVVQMRLNEAPASQFERLGLPFDAPVDETHLQIREAWPRVAEPPRFPDDPGTFASASAGVLTPVRELLSNDATRSVLLKRFPFVATPVFVKRNGSMSPWQLAVMLPSITNTDLRSLHEDLIQVGFQSSSVRQAEDRHSHNAALGRKL
ncbi:sulfatase [Arthrobacter sp. ISL-30]|uniref:sulfatase n=1 Tax=Arthrobacter sp. ISL-30 TaxID=2819109 RepID=UPI001BE93AF0|nr:sulfatase [Arthrobacter sp. ISL-30]MBT2513618.1 sulfatase [Arthrobacter sp. ISL-30]